jgi:hypothetical protein
MKKIGVLLFILLVSVLLVVLVKADTPPVPGIPAGGLNQETGLPTEFDKFQEIGSQLSEEEKRKEYLKREWTKIFAENKFFGPVLFYTSKGFSIFNPFWKAIFGLEFAWSWAFIFSFGLWITLIIFIYSPAKSFLDLNVFLVIAASVIIASLAGIAGAISYLVNLMIAALTNPWYVWAMIIFIILFCIIYYMIMKKYGEKFKEKSAKEQTKADRKVLNVHADATRKAFEKAKQRLKKTF